MSALKTRLRQLNHDLVDAMRDLRRSLLRWLFERDFRGGPVPPQRDVREVLVLRLDKKLGDCITSTGFLGALHQIFPQAQITVMTAPETKWVYEGLGFCRVVPVPKGVGPSLRVWWEHRKIHFDVLVNTSHLISPRVVFLASTIKARQKISFKNPDYKMFSHHVDFDENTDHVTERYRRVLEFLGDQGLCSLEYRVPIPTHYIALADVALTALKDRPFMVVNSFAGARMRNLSEMTTKELIRRLKAKFFDYAVVSIANAGDMRILERWKKEGDIDDWFIFPQCSDFYCNAHIVERAALVISPDTSIVHLASALKRPVVGLYREDLGAEKNVLVWAPFGTKYRIVKSRVKEGMPEQDINEINLDEVVSAAQELL